jgi:hypothetical protein
VTWHVTGGILEPEETAVARKRLDKLLSYASCCVSIRWTRVRQRFGVLQLSDSNKNPVLGSRWGLTPRLNDRLTD